MRKHLLWTVLSLLLGQGPAFGFLSSCPGDCNNDGMVTIAELILGIRGALEGKRYRCESFDQDGSCLISVAELVTGVGAALQGCPTEVRSPTQVGELPTSCGGLGDPLLSCSFDGRWFGPFSDRPAVVEISPSADPGSIFLVVRSPDGERWGDFWAACGATSTSYSGKVQYFPGVGDEVFSAELNVTLSDGGNRIEINFLSGEFFADDMFEGAYVGP